MTLVVYTAIVGHSPDRLQAAPRSPGTQFVCFMDKPEAKPYSGWQLRTPMWDNDPLYRAEPRRLARWHKLHPHVLFPAAETSLWLDGSLELLRDPRELVRQCDPSSPLITFKHPHRTDLYQEYEACLLYRKDDDAIMRPQIDRYHREGYPFFSGLPETSMLLRQHTPAVQAFDEAWWQEIAQGSVRDQLSFPYVAWKQQFRYGLFPPGMHGANCPWLKFRSHW